MELRKSNVLEKSRLYIVDPVGGVKADLPTSGIKRESEHLIPPNRPGFGTESDSIDRRKMENHTDNLADITDRYETCMKTVPIGKWIDLTVLAVRDPDALIDSIDPDEFAQEERLPYWAEIWPSSIALGIHLFEHPVQSDRRILELGCGTGIAGLAAAKAGLDVLACDYDRDALLFAKHNADINGVAHRMSFRELDWRKPNLKEKFSFVIGSDITYERPDHEPILSFLSQFLVPGGTFVLSDPDRSSAPEFVASVCHEGFSHTPQPRRIRYDGKVNKVTVHRFIDVAGSKDNSRGANA